jgi:hypothetical protein
MVTWPRGSDGILLTEVVNSLKRTYRFDDVKQIAEKSKSHLQFILVTCGPLKTVDELRDDIKIDSKIPCLGLGLAQGKRTGYRY